MAYKLPPAPLGPSPNLSAGAPSQGCSWKLAGPSPSAYLGEWPSFEPHRGKGFRAKSPPHEPFPQTACSGEPLKIARTVRGGASLPYTQSDTSRSHPPSFCRPLRTQCISGFSLSAVPVSPGCLGVGVRDPRCRIHASQS